jgi:homogentisate 1,2-dioxygenase
MLQYYHRNAASELVGLIYGKYLGRGGFEPGGLNYTPPFVPHGRKSRSHCSDIGTHSYSPAGSEPFKHASEADLKPQWINDGAIGACLFRGTDVFLSCVMNIAFMFESSMMFTLTDYAMNRTGTVREGDPKVWEDLKP